MNYFIEEYACNPEADVSKLVRTIIDKLENPQEFRVCFHLFQDFFFVDVDV